MDGYTTLTGSYSQGGVTTVLYATHEDKFNRTNQLAVVDSVPRGSKWVTVISYGGREMCHTQGYEIDPINDIVPEIGLGKHITGVPVIHQKIVGMVMEKLPDKYISISEVLEDIEKGSEKK